MTGSPTSPGLILGGGATAFGNGEDDPNALAQIYQNLDSPKPTNEINHGAQL